MSTDTKLLLNQFAVNLLTEGSKLLDEVESSDYVDTDANKNKVLVATLAKTIATTLLKTLDKEL